MESAEATVTRLVFYANITMIERRASRISGDLGWFMCLDGSHEALHIGFDTPPFTVGQRLKITFEGA